MAKIVKTGKKRQKARFNVDIFFMFRCGGVFPGESTINSVSCATRTTPAVFCCVAVWRDDIHSCVEDTAALTEERGPGCCVHCSIYICSPSGPRETRRLEHETRTGTGKSTHY